MNEDNEGQEDWEPGAESRIQVTIIDGKLLLLSLEVTYYNPQQATIQLTSVEK